MTLRKKDWSIKRLSENVKPYDLGVIDEDGELIKSN